MESPLKLEDQNKKNLDGAGDRGVNYHKISWQIIISYFFNLLIIVSQPLLIALLTRFLTVEEYGVYSLLFGTISFLSVFLRFGISEYIRNKLPGLPEEIRIKRIILILVFFSGFLILAGAVLYLIRGEVVRLLKIQDYPHLWIVSIFLVILVAEYEVIDSYLISVKKIILSSVMGFLTKCFWIILLVFYSLFLGNFSLSNVFNLWLFGAGLSIILSIFNLRKEIVYFLRTKLTIESGEISPVLKFSLPLIMVVSFSWLIEVADRYIINHYLPRTELGIYSLAYGLVGSIATIPIIFQNVIQPYFAERWNLQENSSFLFNVLLKYTLLISLPSMVGMFVLRENIIFLFSGEKYLAAAPIIAILLPFSLLCALIYIYEKLMMLQNLIKQIVVIYFFSAIINILLNFILIQKIGIKIAAYSTVIAYAVVFLAMLYYKPTEIKCQWDYLKIGRIFLASLLMGIAISPFSLVSYWAIILLIFFGGLIFILFALILNIFNQEEKKLIFFIYYKLKTMTKKNVKNEQ